MRILLVLVPLMFTGVQSAGAVELKQCGSLGQSERLKCLEDNTSLLNRTVETVVAGLRARLDKIEADLKKLESQRPGWDAGCTNGVCVMAGMTGNLIFFDGSQKQITGSGQLPGAVTGPVSVACNNLPGQEGCIAVDGAGRIWIGSPRGNNYVLVGQIPSDHSRMPDQGGGTDIPPIDRRAITHW